MLRLEKLTKRNVWKVMRLSVTKEQDDFVATNMQSVIEAYIERDEGGYAFPFALYDGDVPVGFLMIGYGADSADDDPPSVAEGNYCLWRLMIDKNYQGRGYGREAVALALDFVRTFPCGHAEYCYLSYEPENAVAAKLYASFGFCENGEKDGDETVAVLKL